MKRDSRFGGLSIPYAKNNSVTCNNSGILRKQFSQPFYIIALFTLMSTSTFAQVEICQKAERPGAWDLVDLGSVDIPINFDVGDASTQIYLLESVSLEAIHTYAGDLGGKLISPAGTEIHLWQLGDGSISPSDDGNGSSCDSGGYKIKFDDTIRTDQLTVATENTFCTGSNVDSLAENSGRGGIEEPFIFNRTNPNDPGIQGTAKPIDPFSKVTGENSQGSWTMKITDSYDGDEGSITSACLSMDFAGVDHEFFVSKDAECSDRADKAVFNIGDDIFICQGVVNKGSQKFAMRRGDHDNELNINLSALAGEYDIRGTTNNNSRKVVSRFTAGEGQFPVGKNGFRSSITIIGADSKFTSDDKLAVDQYITVYVTPPAPTVNVPTNGTPVTGLATPNLEILVTTESGASCTTVTQSTGRWSCMLGRGPITHGDDITAAIKDQYGNIVAHTEKTAIDLTPPQKPVVYIPLVDQKVSGTAEPGTQIKVLLSSGAMCYTTTTQDGLWSCTLNRSPQKEDSITVKATNQAGNSSYTVIENGTTIAPDLSTYINNCSKVVGDTQEVVYEVTVTNHGNMDITNAYLKTSFSDQLKHINWVCDAFNGAECPEVLGEYDINVSLNLPIRASVTYTVSAIVSARLYSMVDSSVDIKLPRNLIDVRPNNNYAEDVDPVVDVIFSNSTECSAASSYGNTSRLLDSMF